MLTAGRGKIRFPVQRYRPLDYESLPVNSYSIVLAYLLHHSDLFWSIRGEEKNGLTGFQCGADSVLNLYIYIYICISPDPSLLLHVFFVSANIFCHVGSSIPAVFSRGTKRSNIKRINVIIIYLFLSTYSRRLWLLRKDNRIFFF